MTLVGLMNKVRGTIGWIWLVFCFNPTPVPRYGQVVGHICILIPKLTLNGSDQGIDIEMYDREKCNRALEGRLSANTLKQLKGIFDHMALQKLLSNALNPFTAGFLSRGADVCCVVFSFIRQEKPSSSSLDCCQTIQIVFWEIKRPSSLPFSRSSPELHSLLFWKPSWSENLALVNGRWNVVLRTLNFWNNLFLQAGHGSILFALSIYLMFDDGCCEN